MTFLNVVWSKIWKSITEINDFFKSMKKLFSDLKKSFFLCMFLEKWIQLVVENFFVESSSSIPDFNKLGGCKAIMSIFRPICDCLEEVVTLFYLWPVNNLWWNFWNHILTENQFTSTWRFFIQSKYFEAFAFEIKLTETLHCRCKHWSQVPEKLCLLLKMFDFFSYLQR